MKVESTKTNTRKLSKAETFEVIIVNLENSFPKGIPKELILSKMIESGIFSKIQARDYLDKLHRSGFLYEPKLGYFSTVC